MKKFVFLTIISFSLFLVSPAFAQETINNFDVSIKINQNSSINVSERIEYDFNGFEKHGIFRNIPIKYAARGGTFGLRISDISIADENGAPYKFITSYPNNNIELKIGDANKLVSGKKIYVINYRINRAINYFDDHDELYWNATGNGWPVPIQKATATIILPKTINKENAKYQCFSGALGSTGGSCSAGYESSNDNLVEKFNFSSNFAMPLSAGEGLTIVVGWPKNLVQPPSALQNILDIIKDNWILVLPLIVFFVMLYLWYTRGRDPKGRGAIYPQYDAPDNLSPAEIGTLIDEKVDQKDISSEIIYLATKGYIKIIRTENKGLIFKHEDYLLEKLKDDTGLPPFDEQIMRGLFIAGESSVKLSDLKNKFYKEIPLIKNQTYGSLVTKGYFPEKPAKTQRKYMLSGTLILIGAYILAKLIGGAIGPLAIGSLVASGILIIIFGLFMPVKTKKGVDTKENIFGLKMYLEIAEKDRIKFHNAPAKNPEHFEKLLPYAMVLGVEKEWAKQFEGIYNQQPAWYADRSGGVFNSMILISSLNNFSHSANAALVAAPRSASGGGSGFGGGGFSGGGFGGGGGGSW